MDGANPNRIHALTKTSIGIDIKYTQAGMSATLLVIAPGSCVKEYDLAIDAKSSNPAIKYMRIDSLALLDLQEGR